MRTLKLFMALALAVCLFACNHPAKVERPNTNAIWLWGTHMMEAPVAEWAEKGYGHILLNEAAFTQWGEDTVYSFIADCEKLGMTVHVWFQAFYEKGKWICPVDDQTHQLKQDYYDKVVARAVDYAKKGVAGIHLDYIRYGGTAYKHDYPESRATFHITEFCRQLNQAVKPINPNIILSAALMPEINSEYYYGQNPMQMGKYLDILMPMVYRYGYAGEDKPLSWVEEVCNWFTANSGGAQVWAGIQTYTLDLTRTNEHPIEMCADSILADCKDIVNTNAHGIVLFRHGLGQFPDVHGLWDNKPLPQPRNTHCATNCATSKCTTNCAINCRASSCATKQSCGEKKSCSTKQCENKEGGCKKQEGCNKESKCGKKQCASQKGGCNKDGACNKEGNCNKSCGEKQNCGKNCGKKTACDKQQAQAAAESEATAQCEGNCSTCTTPCSQTETITIKEKHNDYSSCKKSCDKQQCSKQQTCNKENCGKEKCNKENCGKEKCNKENCGKEKCNKENCNKEGALGYVTASKKSVPVKEFTIAITMYNTILVDVRTEKEHNEGFIPGTHYHLNVLDEGFEQKALETLCKCKNIAIYCRSGNRSKKAMDILYKNGYNVIELATGANGWVEAGKELVKK